MDTKAAEAAEKARMRLSREVRIGELLSALTALVLLAGWYVKVSLDPIEHKIRALQLRNDQQDQVSIELKREIRDDLKALRDKVDRLLEHQPAPQQSQAGSRR